MPLTFEQAQQWVENNGPASIPFSMIRTQGDGRVGYLSGDFKLSSPDQLEVSDLSSEAFSDRVAILNVQGLNYQQPFDYNDLNRNRDETLVKFRRVGPSKYELEVTFVRWTQMAETLSMNVFPRTSVYAGVGPPIGQSNFFALYIITLDSIRQLII